MPLQDAGEVIYTIIVESGQHFACEFIIIADKEKIDIKTVFFSKLVNVACS